MIASIDEANQARPATERVSIRRACALLEVSASGYYAWRDRGPADREVADAELAGIVKDVHEDKKRRYGIRRIRAELARRGRHHGEARLRRLVRSQGLACVHPASGPKTTVPDGRSADLIDFIGRVFAPARPGEVLYTDITYIATAEQGWTYLVLFTDACSRRIVSWEVDTVMDTPFVLRALDKALADLAPEPGQLIVHSDRGGQYTSNAFRDRCFDAGVIPSVGRTGSCFDNAQAESTNATIKKELINLRTWKKLDEVRLALFEYIQADYNRDRIQQALGFLTPEEFEQLHPVEFTPAA
ncbi:IS3 family transposase [Glycomyces salinus]|uniref:IS3 family transposase n=1 Tax=Glycomyces salinus TaxID=980294 RepID=UPI0018EAB720|nr:IS3 family transposase [Glycomyces salinus]